MQKRKLNKIASVCYLVAFLLLVVNVFLISIELKQSAIRQEDMLNQIMNLRQEIETVRNDLSEENVSVDTLVQNTEKVALSFDKDLIERVVAAESRGDTFEGMMAVAQSIKDRGDLWNMSYEDVVNAPNQYAEPYQGQISEEVKLAVEYVFIRGYRVTEEPITHFHSCSVEPYWTTGKVNRGSLGSNGHTFYY